MTVRQLIEALLTADANDRVLIPVGWSGIAADVDAVKVGVAGPWEGKTGAVEFRQAQLGERPNAVCITARERW